jgi:hypothetical protein
MRAPVLKSNVVYVPNHAPLSQLSFLESLSKLFYRLDDIHHLTDVAEKTFRHATDARAAVDT